MQKKKKTHKLKNVWMMTKPETVQK